MAASGPWTTSGVISAVLGLSLAGFGCGRSDEIPKAPNLVLVSIDSLRADHLSGYGYERDTSPTLDRLAAEGTLFEIATSSSSWTLPAHASLFTGLPDSVHGVDRGARRLAPARRTLAETLGAAGYRTAGVWSGPLLSPRFGFGQGFDDYVSHAAEADDWQAAVDRSHTVVTGPETLAQVERLLPSLAGESPFFLFVHLWDVHYDYIPPEPYAGRFTTPDYAGPIDGRGLVDLVFQGPGDLSEDDLRELRALYDGEVAWVDHQVGNLLDLLRDAGALSDTVIVITSDHGEEFFERGFFGHKRHLFDESIRIPLIVWGPGRIAAGRRDGQPARLVDIAPTLVELGGAEPLPSVMGLSLVGRLSPLDRPVPTQISPRAVAELVQDPNTGRALLAVRTVDWKLVLRPDSGTPVGLWNLREDPEEQINVVDQRPDLLSTAIEAAEAELEELQRLRELHPRADGSDASETLAEDLRAQLESLGYLDPRSHESTLWTVPAPLPICDGSGLGIVEVHWKLERPLDVLIRVGSADGKLFLQGGPEGHAPTGKWVRDGTRFVLQDHGSGEVLGETIIRSTTAGCRGL